jgi:hypothetical protein
LPLFRLSYQPWLVVEVVVIIDSYGAVGGIRMRKGNPSTWRKPAPLTICPLQIPYYLIWDGTQAAMMGIL